jgi:hypothetical protein
MILILGLLIVIVFDDFKHRKFMHSLSFMCSFSPLALIDFPILSSQVLHQPYFVQFICNNTFVLISTYSEHSLLAMDFMHIMLLFVFYFYFLSLLVAMGSIYIYDPFPNCWVLISSTPQDSHLPNFHF